VNIIIDKIYIKAKKLFLDKKNIIKTEEKNEKEV